MNTEKMPVRTAAIMQPTYLPWSGYFNLIANVDEFVFLDDVQLDKRSWQTRNRILVNENVVTLSVPVQKCSRSTKICDAYISEHGNWRTKHADMIKSAYENKGGWNHLQQILGVIADSNIAHLAELNSLIIKQIVEILGLKTNFHMASDLESSGRRSEYLYNICAELEVDEYLSPKGSADYLDQDKVFVRKKDQVKLRFQEFEPAPYPQNVEIFESHLSIIDLIANIGPDRTRDYLIK